MFQTHLSFSLQTEFQPKAGELRAGGELGIKRNSGEHCLISQAKDCFPWKVSTAPLFPASGQGRPGEAGFI